MKLSNCLALIATSISALAAPASVTFNKEVLPVLQKHCQECHRPGEAAPMSFLSYKETRPYAKAMKQAVLAKKMPPWFADAHYGKFANDRTLAKADIDTLIAWADGGAKEGNSADAPAARQFTKGWAIGKPDAVLDLSVDYKVPAKGTIDYTYFIIPTGFTEDKWIEKIEVRPTARQVVHHIVLYARPQGSKMMKGAPVRTAFVPKKSDAEERHEQDNGEGVLYGLTSNYFEMLSVYVPGGMPYETKPGQARLLKAGSDLIFQMHYTANGTETVDRSQVGIVFAKEPPKERVVNTFIANFNLHIPAGAADHRVDAKVTLYEDVVLQNLFPHMHLRGKAFQYVAKYPSGETQTLLKVPKYDFNWQLTYELEKPLLLPKGTVLTATAWFDNSPGNKFNPDPKSEVYWGDQSWEEMLAGFADFVIPVNMNPMDIGKPKKPAAKPAGAE
jgi:hypothetical protein